MKSFFFTLLFLSSSTLYAQLSYFHFYEDFPIVKNTDSLEKVISIKRTHSQNYLSDLVSLEKSRHAYQSEKFGTNLKEIERMASIHKSSLVIAVGQLLMGTFEIRNEVSKATPSIIAATRYFEQIRDTTAILLCYSLMISVNKSPGTNNIGTATEQVRGSLESIKTYYHKIQLLAEQSNSVLDKIIQLQTTIAYHALVYPTVRLTEEEKAIKTALSLVQQHPEYEYSKIVIYNRAVTLYQNAGQNKKALEYELACYQMNNNHQKALFNNNLSYSYQLVNDYAHAELYAKKAVVLSQNNQDIDLQIAVYYLLSDAQYGLKKYDEAWANKNIADSLYQVNEKRLTDKTYLELQTKYETEKKEQTNQELSERQQRLYTYLFLGLLIIIMSSVIVFRLRFANSRIKELMRHRDQFYTIVAHDLLGPISTLTDISKVIPFLVKQNRTSDLEQVTQRINTVSAEASLLLNNLIEWGKSNNYKVVTKQQLFDAAQLLNELYNSHKALTEAKGIILSIDIPDKLELTSDPKSFSLIVRNILDNARKFTSNGETIKIRSTIHNNLVQIHIEDSGQGIPLEQLEYIQNVFAGKIKPEVGEHGLGLGIILINDFAHKNNITLSVTSKLGAGSCYSLSIRTRPKRTYI